MEDHLDTELMNIINNNNNYHRGQMSPSRLGSSMSMNMNQQHASYDLASLLNSAKETSVTTMALPRSFINIPTNSSSAMSSNITSGTTTPSTGLMGRPNATGNGAVKVKKKRVRASRRVPTTVLRTDTSNFKAMVQHFTGVPIDTSSSTSSPTTTTTTSNPISSEPPFTKPLPHPAVCKIPPSTQNKPSTSSAAGLVACLYRYSCKSDCSQSEVAVLSPDNFDSVVLGESKLVLCQFLCTKIYEMVAIAYKLEKDVVTANIDANKYKELAEKYGVFEFSTLKLFPKTNKAGEDYDSWMDLLLLSMRRLHKS